ncbi:hypothetical protein C0Q70_14744 [Pomacea canaliculata]|uniref:Uncharacterized protein n=1 Tax=Pomacea canaliculata TaxID=400727 RepID=A0A2T7NSZ7_POMCA|nr:hypothetical protein C0Q70_14744 [Pomacea canaliculata]
MSTTRNVRHPREVFHKPASGLFSAARSKLQGAGLGEGAALLATPPSVIAPRGDSCHAEVFTGCKEHCLQRLKGDTLEYSTEPSKVNTDNRAFGTQTVPSGRHSQIVCSKLRVQPMLQQDVADTDAQPSTCTDIHTTERRHVTHVSHVQRARMHRDKRDRERHYRLMEQPQPLSLHYTQTEASENKTRRDNAYDDEFHKNPPCRITTL